MPPCFGALGIGAHEAEHPVGELRVRRPHLLAVDDELVADELGARLERRQVGAGARLGVALAPDLVGGEDLRQIAPALLLGAVRDQRRADHLHAHHADQPRRARPHHLLVDDRLAHDVGALAAVLASASPWRRSRPRRPCAATPSRRRCGAGRPNSIGRSSRCLLGDVLPEPGAHLALEGELFGRVGEVHRVGRVARRRGLRQRRTHARGKSWTQSDPPC